MKRLIIALSIWLALFSALANSEQFSDIIATEDLTSAEHAFLARNEKDFKLALSLFMSLATQNYASAQQFVGAMYEEGEGMTKNYEQAIHWYRKAAVKKNTSAQYALGLMHLKGRGVDQDFIHAQKWLILAAAQGDSKAERLRDLMSTYMMRDQITKAQVLATKCMESDYQDCR